MQLDAAKDMDLFGLVSVYQLLLTLYFINNRKYNPLRSFWMFSIIYIIFVGNESEQQSALYSMTGTPGLGSKPLKVNKVYELL